MRWPMLNPIQLLAQNENEPGKFATADLEEISRLRNEGVQHELPWELLLVGLGTTLIVIVVITARRWWLARQDDPSPLVLYSAIARKAGLSWSDRFILWRVARASDLPTPIALLLARGTLRHHAKSFAKRLSPKSAERFQARIGQIEAELFR